MTDHSLAAAQERKAAYNRAYYALVGNKAQKRSREIAARYATRSGRWSDAEDKYLINAVDSVLDIALDLKRTYDSVKYRIAFLHREGITLASDLPRTTDKEA